MTNLTIADVLAEIGSSYAKARGKHAPMRGPHEGYAVLLEEVDELWDEVKAWQPDDQNAEKMRKEALHVAAMALAFLLEAVPK
jgi:NTP pyrophosphatase (non-canonical NTP hydrolase)